MPADMSDGMSEYARTPFLMHLFLCPNKMAEQVAEQYVETGLQATPPEGMGLDCPTLMHNDHVAYNYTLKKSPKTA